MKHRKSSSAYISALLGSTLLCTGTVWILNELHVISLPFYKLVGSFYYLWPLILIVLGLCMLFRSRIVAVALGFIYSVIIVLNALGLFGIASPDYLWHQSFDNNSVIYRSVETTDSSEFALSPDIISASMNLSAGVPKEILLTSQNGINLFDIKTDTNRYTINNYVSDTDNSRMMFDVYAAVSATDQIFLELNEAVQWDIDIRSDAEKINLDLEKLNVASIDIECDVAKIDAKLSSLSPAKVFVNVFSDICDIQFSLPKDSGYEITSYSDVTSINTDSEKIAGLGEKSYRSANFETSRQIFYIYISSDTSNITILQK